MHNLAQYKATFRDLIVLAFGKHQVLKWRGEITMFQIRDSPELWSTHPMMSTGRRKWEAASPRELAKILEESFVKRESKWVEIEEKRPSLAPRPAENVVPIDLHRRRA